MKKYLFPFQKTYAMLKNYVWHRVFVVLFFIVVVAIPTKLFISEINLVSLVYYQCIVSSATSYSRGIIDAEPETNCKFLSPNNFIVEYSVKSSVILVGLFYLLQILYFFGYKVFRYIVAGSESKIITNEK